MLCAKFPSKLKLWKSSSTTRVNNAENEENKEQASFHFLPVIDHCWKGSSPASRNSIRQEEICKDTESSVHPLLIDHVLEAVLRHVINQEDGSAAAKDIGNIKLVCRQWEAFATRMYRDISPHPIVLQFRADTVAKPKYASVGLSDMAGFLDTIATTGRVPVQRFEILGLEYTVQNKKLMQDFLRICGPELISLTLYVEGNDILGYPMLLDPAPACNSLRKLKTLEFQLMDHHWPTLCRTNAVDILIRDFWSFSQQLCHACDCEHLEILLSNRIPTTVKNTKFAPPHLPNPQGNLNGSVYELEFQFDRDRGGEEGWTDFESELIKNFFERGTKFLPLLFGGRQQCYVDYARVVIQIQR